MVIFGPSVFYLFGPLVINSVMQFSIYSALQIQPNGSVRKIIIFQFWVAMSWLPIFKLIHDFALVFGNITLSGVTPTPPLHSQYSWQQVSTSTYYIDPQTNIITVFHMVNSVTYIVRSDVLTDLPFIVNKVGVDVSV